MLAGAMPSGVKAMAEEPPRALREVERLSRNPEKLANADGRFWKDTIGRKRSFKTHRPPYPTKRGLVTDWQETKNSYMTNLDGQCQRGPEGEKYPKTTRTGKSTQKSKKRSMEESCESLVAPPPPPQQKKKKKKKTKNN